MKKRFLSILLALTMCLSLIPGTALAASEPGSSESNPVLVKNRDELKAAINSAPKKTDFYIKLTSYIYLANPIQIFNKYIHIDGDGKGITRDFGQWGNNNAYAIHVMGSSRGSRANLHLKNIKITNFSCLKAPIYLESSAQQQSIFKNVTIKDCSGDTAYAIQNDSNLILEDSYVTCLSSSKTLIHNSGNLTLQGSKNCVSNTSSYASESSGLAIFNSGTIIANGGIVTGNLKNGVGSDPTNMHYSLQNASVRGGSNGTTTFYGDVINYGRIHTGTFKNFSDSTDKLVSVVGVLSTVTTSKNSIVSGGDFSKVKNTSGLYTVTFNTNGGSTAPAKQWRTNATATKPKDPTKSGYIFLGWYNGNSKWNFDTNVTSSITLTAKWHRHSWNKAWQKNDTHHWHSCTTDCPTTSNSQKNGYTTHKYNQTVATDTYKASEATETQSATYYKSCICGAKGTETFTVCEANGHSYQYAADGSVITETCTVDGCGYSATATITAPTEALIYDGTTAFDASVAYSSIWSGGELSIFYQKDGSSPGDTKGAGTYTASITKGEGITADVTYTVNKATVTPPTIEEKAYTGQTQTAEVATSSLYTVATNNGGTTPGDYDVVLNLTDPNNYEWETENTDKSAPLTLTFSITPAFLDGVFVELTDSMDYDGTAQTVGVVTRAITVDDTPATFTYKTEIDDDYSETIPSFTTAGNHTVYYQVTAENHKPVKDGFLVTITPATLTDVSVTPKNMPLTYNGTAQTAEVTTSATALNNAPVTFTYSTEKEGTYGEMPSFTDVGPHTVYYQATAANHEPVSGEFTVTIDKATVTIQAVNKRVYVNSTAPDFSAPVLNSDYTVTGLLGSDTLPESIQVALTCTPDMAKTGDYTITTTVTGEDPHYNLQAKDGTLTVANPPSSGGGGGGGSTKPPVTPPTTTPITPTTPPSSTTVTVPVASDKGSVSVDASVKDSTATVAVSDKQIEEVAADGSGTVTVDVSSIETVDSARIPAHVVEKTNTAAETSLTVALPTGSVSLDETALESVNKSEDITVSVQQVPATDLTEAQQAAVGDMTNIGLVVDVDLFVGSEKQSSFNGGKLTISVPYTPKQGEDTSKLTVWFIRDDGTIENKGGYYDADKKCFVFETDHLSRYILVNTENALPFTDVPANAYYYDAVAWAILNGITTGMTETTFGPDVSCTRAQIVTFLWRAAGQPEVTDAKNPFSDVSESDYFYQAVLWAVENKITTGTTETTFSPEETCTRAQAAAFIYRNEQANGGGFTDAWAFQLPFTDVPAWCYEAVAWCYMNGVTQGTSETTFSPNLDCTRAQIVTMLYRANQLA